MTAPSADFEGRRVLVTGGTRGIGAAAARAFAAAGAHVLVSARTAPDEHPFPVVVADLGTAAGVQHLADEAVSRVGGVDVLVSNVGGQIRRPGVLDFSDDDWQQELNLNLLAAVRLDRALVPGMIAGGGGAVVHVSSQAAGLARPESVAYSAGKAALNAYSKGLATEVGAHGVRVNVVLPGFIPTSRISELAAERDVEPEVLTRQVQESLAIPLGRAGSADEVAQLILFLASPQASYLTGAQFAVDGGAYPTV